MMDGGGDIRFTLCTRASRREIDSHTMECRGDGDMVYRYISS